MEDFLGIGPSTSLTITNLTPFYAELHFIEHHDVEVAPGQAVFDKWHYEFDHTVVPIAVQFYRDSSMTFEEGVEGYVVYITKGQPSSWTITSLHDLNGAVKTFGDRSGYPSPMLGGERQIDIPRIAILSTAVIQVINDTRMEAQVRLDGKTIGTLEPGGIYAREESFMYNNISRSVQLYFSVNGEYAGYWDSGNQTFYVNQPSAYQRIVTSSDVRH